MQIADDHIDDFIVRWEAAFSERLSREAARTVAIRLVNLYRLILRPTDGAVSDTRSSSPDA